METFSALLAICAGNSPVSGEFPAQRPVTRCFDIFFDLRLNKRLSKQSWGWWFETLSCPLWRQCNVHLIGRYQPTRHGTNLKLHMFSPRLLRLWFRIICIDKMADEIWRNIAALRVLIHTFLCVQVIAVSSILLVSARHLVDIMEAMTPLPPKT